MLIETCYSKSVFVYLVRVLWCVRGRTLEENWAAHVRDPVALERNDNGGRPRVRRCLREVRSTARVFRSTKSFHRTERVTQRGLVRMRNGRKRARFRTARLETDRRTTCNTHVERETGYKERKQIIVRRLSDVFWERKKSDLKKSQVRIERRTRLQQSVPSDDRKITIF
jgi:hypothetical protein